MVHVQVDSSNVESAGHDPATSTLEVRFKGGGTYAYEGVTAEQFAALTTAPSVGKYLNQAIKPNHPATRIG